MFLKKILFMSGTKITFEPTINPALDTDVYSKHIWESIPEKLRNNAQNTSSIYDFFIKDLGKKLIIEYDYVVNTITENENQIIRIGITD